ncbi:MAG: hypothetical protein ABIP68_05930 [Ferruginibacter sp.]
MRTRLITLIAFIIILVGPSQLSAQCAMCTKTAAQLGEKPAQGMNSGIVYLMLTPFLVMGYIGYRWYRSQEKAKIS